MSVVLISASFIIEADFSSGRWQDAILLLIHVFLCRNFIPFQKHSFKGLVKGLSIVNSDTSLKALDICHALVSSFIR